MLLNQIDSNIGTWETDLISNKQIWSKNCIKILGFSSLNEPSWEELLAIVHPQDRQQVMDVTREHNTKYEVEYRIISGTDDIRWIRLVGQVERDANGKPQIMHGIMQDISNHKYAEIKLLESESRLQEAQNHAGIASWELTRGSETTIWSKQICQLMGLQEDFQPSPDKPYQLINASDCQAVIDSLQHSFDTGDEHQLEYRIRRHDNGAERWIECRGKAVLDSHGIPEKLTGFIQDITERKQAEHQLRIAATAFESQEGIMITDSNNVILQVNKAFTIITGYNAEEAIGNKPSMLSSEHHDALFYDDMWKEINLTGYWEGEIWNKRNNGEVYPEERTVTAVRDSNDIVANYVVTLTDITLSKQAEQKIEYLAYYDSLTHLPNRQLMLDRIRHAIVSNTRSDNEAAILFLDLDHFKTLNDTLGHDMGDILLQQVAGRLTECVREGDTVSRFGGDEFVVLLEDLSVHPIEAAAQVKNIANKILSSINRPYQLASHHYMSSASIGVTLFSNHQSEVSELIKQADIAMYQAKKDGRNALLFFDPKMQSSITEQAKLESELNQAIEQQQFQLQYQIQMNSSHRPLGAEALILWIHPKRGVVSPLDFISLAEQNGTILAIGQWVLNKACAQLKVWQQDALTCNLTLSVNVSAKQFNQPNFISQVVMTVRHHDINPARLKLELTESMLLKDIEDTIAKMKSLADIGIQFSLDDFGTGYSSLQYLKQLPLHQLKIDKSFVDDLVTDNNDQAIVRTIIAMAHGLGLSVIAEGVETKEQQQQLLTSGCTLYQGYLFGKPASIAEFNKLLKEY